ncbi:MAG: DinB family protein [Pseudomonadota bacterium]
MTDQPGAPRPTQYAAQAELLEQLRALILAVDPEQYRGGDQRLPGSTFGRQVRHCIDHLLQFLAGLSVGTIDYGARERDAELELNPASALARLDAIEQQLAQLEPLPEALVLRLEDGTTVPTSAARELEFLNSHTVHHLAVLGLLARELGVEVPEAVGMAFSTLAHRQSIA